MDMRTYVTTAAHRLGYQVQKHPARRRAQLLSGAGVDLVLDVGAATGHYGRDLRRFGYAGRIVSFEPLAASRADLETAAAADPRWDVQPVGLGDVTGKVVLNVAANGDSSSVLPMLERHEVAAPHARYVRSEKIDVFRLDDLAPEVIGAAERPFLKLDVQGFERQVLQGAADTAPMLAGIELEVSLVPLYDGGMLLPEAVTLMQGLGLTPMNIEPAFLDRTSGQLLQVDVLFLRQPGADAGSVIRMA